MNGFLDHLIYHIASGQAFFLGGGLILFGLALSATVKSKALLVLRDLGVIVGGIIVTISAVPLPYWFYGMLGFATVTWLVLEWLNAKVTRKGSCLFAWRSLLPG